MKKTCIVCLAEEGEKKDGKLIEFSKDNICKLCQKKRAQDYNRYYRKGLKKPRKHLTGMTLN